MENARKIAPVKLQETGETDTGIQGCRANLKAPDQEHRGSDTEDNTEHGAGELSAFGGAGLDAHADTEAARRISAALACAQAAIAT